MNKTAETIVSSATKSVTISGENPTVLIGERINPTGKKRLQQALITKDLALIKEMAIKQVSAGADIIDVNVGLVEINEVELLPAAVKAVAEAVEAPICIDTSNIAAMSAALEICPGRPLLNSVNGEENSLEQVLPLAKKYGVPVIGLVSDETGIPMESEHRLTVAEKIISRAEKYGIPRHDVIIDCLALTVGADHLAGKIFLDTVHLIRSKLGVNITVGASNISFGMPQRDDINNAFLAMAIMTGVNCPLVDPAKTRQAILLADLLMGKDRFAMRYLSYYREKMKSSQGETK